MAINAKKRGSVLEELPSLILQSMFVAQQFSYLQVLWVAEALHVD